MRYLFVLLLLAGCATEAELEADARAQNEAASASRMNSIASRCSAYGFTPGADDFKRCAMQLDLEMRRQDDALIRGLILQDAATPRPTYRPALAGQSGTHCISDGAGGMRCSPY